MTLTYLVCWFAKINPCKRSWTFVYKAKPKQKIIDIKKTFVEMCNGVLYCTTLFTCYSLAYSLYKYQVTVQAGTIARDFVPYMSGFPKCSIFMSGGLPPDCGVTTTKWWLEGRGQYIYWRGLGLQKTSIHMLQDLC